MTDSKFNYQPVKTCSCGFEFHEIPDGGIFQDGLDGLAGYYFNCDLCHSTLFMTKAQMLQTDNRRYLWTA